MNLAYHYPIIYWNTACLIVNAGADDQVEENKSTDYGKIATAISNIQKRGEHIDLPLINSTDFGFIPDEKNNRIIYSIKAINGIGDDVARLLIQNRPYTSMEDFYSRMIDTKLIKVSQMIKLIKAGCFKELHSGDRKATMADFLSRYVVKTVDKLTLSQFERLMKFNDQYQFIPEKILQSIQYKFFADYVLDEQFLFKKYVDESKKRIPKVGYHDRWFKLDDTSMSFFINHYSEDSVEMVNDGYYIVSEKKFTKENVEKLEPFKNWLTTGEAVAQYNDCLMKEAYGKYAEGTVAKWEMDSLSIYCTQEHELAEVNLTRYGVEDFFSQSPIPEVYDHFTRRIKQGDSEIVKQFPKYRIYRIAGTVLDKNKNRHTVTILTTTGVVNVKFDKGQFAHYDRQLEDKSWFTRGNKILVAGFRRDDQFVAKKYTDTIWKHTCNLITDVCPDGSITVVMERR